MKSYATAFSLATFAAQVAAHGYLTSPKPRMPGDALAAACGSQVFNMWSSDINGNVQTALQVAGSQSDFKSAECNLWLCKGMKFEDNAANVQTFTAGETVPITFNVAAPHTGVANMSIVDTASGAIIGEPLISFEDYASTATGVTDDEKNFDVTIPSDLGSQCATPGACVLQFWWDARSIDQTYESCIDFTIGGSGSDSGSGNGNGASSSAPAATASAPAATSAAAQPTATVVKAPSSTSAAAEAPSATAGSGSGSGSTLPEEFTVQQFISWLKAETGASTASARRHARAFF